MTSFLEEMRVQFGEIVSETLKMEEFMGQYGFKSKSPVNLEDILNWDVPQESALTPPAAAEFGKEVLENIDTADTSVHDTDTMHAVPMSKPKSKTPPALCHFLSLSVIFCHFLSFSVIFKCLQPFAWVFKRFLSPSVIFCHFMQFTVTFFYF